MNRNQELLEKASYPKLLLNLCVPTVIIMLVMMIYNMADIFFIGRTGDPTKIAAVSLCGPVFSILSGLGTLLGSGGCTAISLSFGRKEYDKIKSYSSFCCYGALILGFLFLAIILTVANPLVQALGADADTIDSTLNYLHILALGAPVILFANVFGNIIRADGAAKQSMVANGLGTIANILLDALFILGLSWDVAGAALATVLGNCVSCSYLLFYILKRQPALSLHPKHFSVRLKISLTVISLGLPLACSTLLMSFSRIIANRMVVGYDSIALAAQGISGKIGMLLSMLAMGICMGMQPALSYSYSSGNPKRMQAIIKNTAIFTVLTGTLIAIVCFFARNALIAAFIDDEQVISYGQTFILASIVTGPFYGLYQLCQSFLQSTGKSSYATFVALMDKGLFYLPILFLMHNIFGLYGIAFTSAVTLLFSLSAGGILSILWHKKITANLDPIPASVPDPICSKKSIP